MASQVSAKSWIRLDAYVTFFGGFGLIVVGTTVSLLGGLQGVGDTGPLWIILGITWLSLGRVSLAVAEIKERLP